MLLGVAMSLTACIDDESKYGGNEIPAITIAGVSQDEMPEVNFYHGEEAVITPQINYTGSGNLTYEWSVGTYNNSVKGELVVVSDQPEFRHLFPSGGSYYAHLKVTDGSVGMVQEYQVNINRTFEKGYMVVSNSSAGIGNLVFIKDMTDEEIASGVAPIAMEHCLERVNEGVPQERLAGALIIQLSWPVRATRVVTATATKAYYLDPNTFTAISTIDLNAVVPGFKGAKMLGAAQNPRVFDPAAKRYVTLQSNDMFGYEEAANIGLPYDDFAFGSYSSWGNINYDIYYMTNSPFSINAYGYYSGWSSTADLMWEGAPLFGNEDNICVFMGESYREPGAYADSHPCYVITRDKTTGDYYTSQLSGFGAYDSGVALVGRDRMNVTASTAVPDNGASIIPSNTYHRTYYPSGSAVYVMLKDGDKFNLPNKDQYCLSFTSDEEVTFMTINGEDLVVATCNKSNGRGNVYFYPVSEVRTDNPNPSPRAVYKNCADRISYIVYKPRVAN